MRGTAWPRWTTCPPVRASGLCRSSGATPSTPNGSRSRWSCPHPHLWAQHPSLWAMLVEAWLPRAAAAHPERTAIETPAGSSSYSELLNASRSGADQLARRGAHPGQRVAIAVPPGLAFAEALHACLLLGAVAVPVDVRLSAAERGRLPEK